MIKIIAPATSANLGPGFDSLGIAFELYNVFEVEKSKEFIVIGCPKKFQNEDNLFIQAFKKVTSAAKKRLKCKVDIKANIPLERGLGSSASLICAGLVAANELLAKPFSKDELFQMAAEMEGHPDNVAPCIFGGLHLAYQDEKDRFCDYILHLANNVYFTVIIPPYKVLTKKAREVLPETVKIKDAVKDIQKALLLVKSLEYGDHFILRRAYEDKMVTPYRKALIKDYDKVLKTVHYCSGSCLVISGSGSTMLAISDNSSFDIILKEFLDPKLKVKNLKVDYEGTRVIESDEPVKKPRKRVNKKSTVTK